MTDIGICLAYGFAAMLGYALTERILGARAVSSSLKVFLAPGAGLGLISFILFVQLVLFGRYSLGMTIIILILAGIGVRLTPPRMTSPTDKGLIICLALTFLFILFKLAKSPYGSGLDVWAIWHMKARFVFRGPDEWRLIFSKSLDFSHPDYPIFYPLSLVWGWLIGGGETIRASQIISFMFTLGCVGIMHEFFKIQKYKFPYLAALLLLSTPHFIGMGASQYADILVAYFYLATIALFILSERFSDNRYAVLAGVFAGLASFTKNEGLAFCAACLIVFYAARRPMARDFIKGILPGLTTTAIFKWVAAAPSQQITRDGVAGILSQPAVMYKTKLILSAFTQQIFHENHWVYGLIFVAAALIFCPNQVWNKKRRYLFGLLMILLFIYLSYYLIAPADTTPLLQTSLDRLLLHLYPVFVLFSMEIAYEVWYDLPLWTGKSDLERV